MVTPLSPESFHISITNTLMGRDPVLPDCAELPADSNAMKTAELEGSSAQAVSSSSVGDESSGYESGMSSSENQSVCNKKGGNKCTKNKCAKGCCTGKARRVKVVSSSEAETSENAETTESAGDETTEESHSSSVKAKKNKNKSKKKGKAAKAKSSTENESSAQTEDASTDADTSAKSSKASNNVDTNWSISEDCRLRSMKEAGETWNFIASSLCKGKNDVRARWKVLQSQTTTSEPTTEAETGNATTEAETEGETNPEENKTDNQENEESKEEEEASSKGKAKVKVKGKEKANNAKTETKTNSSVNNKWHKGTRNNKVATENKKAKARAKAKTSKKSASSIASGEEASVESPNVESSESSSRFGYGDPEKQQEMKYLQDHIYGELYPVEIHPKPDAYLGKRDCELLATIDSKYKRSRWLEMQANFYNVTGRMVPLEAIRARCERAEAEEEERAAGRKLASRINKVEKWIAKQTHEDSES
ncbi:hypothetical protein FSARC_3808 [Fusarium sarcochroum]|uniref:Myb-like domain-containing protein n=1 Tax=Fusarium sarcochroum TaxID=1208366 RepID=A0A8H4U3L9_9HYPO|nr:hypothetical protein FSARC_3808 [Fusarium sarcochroum]